MYDAILVTDTAEPPFWTRGYGAHRLASHLRLNGYSVLVIDFSSALSYDIWLDICRHSLSEQTKMIGFSTTWFPFRDPETNAPVTELLDFKHVQEEYKAEFIRDFATGRADRWINIAKQYAPNAKVILGGSKINNYLDVPADHFVIGFGETQTMDLLSQPNRIWDRVIQHDRTAKSCSWSWNHSQTTYQDEDLIKEKEFLTLETSRGCRFACKFCSYPLIGQKNMMSYMKDQDTLYEELMYNYNKWGITDYRIADDTFNDSTDKLEYLLEVIRRLPFQITTRAYVRLDVIAVDLKQIEMLKELGIKYSWVGIDSFHPKASKVIGKGMPAEKRKEALIKMKEAWGSDTEIVTSYIIGLPHEDSRSVEKSFSWLTDPSSPVDRVEFIPLRLNPLLDDIYTDRSEFDINYEKYGYKIPNLKKFWEWEKYDGSDVTSFEVANKLSYSLNSFFNQRPRRKLNIPPRVHIEDPVTEYFEPLTKVLKQNAG